MNYSRRRLLVLALSVPLVACSSEQSQTLEALDPKSLRLEMVQFIVDYEARRGPDGKVIVYKLPRGDGGGRFEVAGINERYHRAEAVRLRRIIEAGDPDQAEREAVKYIAGKTDFPARVAKTNTIKFLLRDIAWNRGPTGAVRTLQIALKVTVDGRIGPQTRGALEAAETNPMALVSAIRSARETYERRWAGRDETSKFWDGLVNRWNKASAQSKKYL
jgi:hypothetical protein